MPTRLFFLGIMVVLMACAPHPADRVDSHGGLGDGLSGIEGQTLIGPTCPVARAGDPNCGYQPFQASLQISKDGSRLARLSSDAEGHFRVALAPGSYVIAPESGGVSARPLERELSVTVRAGEFTQVTVLYDSGIR